MRYEKPVMVQDVNNSVIECDEVVWYVVAIAILFSLAIVIVAGCVAYCLIKGKSFTGSYSFVNNKHDVRLGCE